MKRKIYFDLETAQHFKTCNTISIIGQVPEDKPYVSIYLPETNALLYISDKDLKLFIKNLNKATAKRKYKQKW
jgi:hypothetical protein